MSDSINKQDLKDFKEEMSESFLKIVNSSVEVTLLKSNEKLVERITQIKEMSTENKRDIDENKRIITAMFKKVDDVVESIDKQTKALADSTAEITTIRTGFDTVIEGLKESIKSHDETIIKIEKKMSDFTEVFHEKCAVDRYKTRIVGGIMAFLTLLFLGVQAYNSR